MKFDLPTDDMSLVSADTLAAGKIVAGLQLTFADKSGVQIRLRLTTGEFAQLVARGATLLGIDALRNVVEETMPIHIIHHGYAVCDTEWKYAFPSEWPSGWSWVRREDLHIATCKKCLEGNSHVE